MSLKAGRLRQFIEIQRPVKTQDASTGAMRVSWETLYDAVPASIEPLSVREFSANAREGSAVSARIVVRALNGLDHSMRVLHGDKIYDVEGVLADAESGREYLTLAVSEGKNNG